MTNALDTLERRATRGHVRGADDVFARAVSVPRNRPRSDRPRRVAAVLAVAVVIALVAAAVLALRADDGTDQGPVDEVPAPEIQTGPTGTLIDGPVFGAETGTTLIASGGQDGRLVALDLDTGNVMAAPGPPPDSPVLPVGDRLTFVDGDALVTQPTDFSTEPTPLPGLVNDRTRGFNDDFRLVRSGNSDRLWVQSGPLADAPNREFLASERSIAGEVTSPLLHLGRIEQKIVGATSNTVFVQVDGVQDDLPGNTEVRDPVTQAVRATLPMTVHDTRGDLMVGEENCDGCPLYVMNTVTGEGRELSLDGPLDLFDGWSISPNGTRFAAFTADVARNGELSESALVMVDLSDGSTTNVPVPDDVAFFGRAPIWSPDGSWVFAAGDPEGGELAGWRVGDEAVKMIYIEGFTPWSLVGIDRADGPNADEIGPCDGQITSASICHTRVWSGRAEAPMPYSTTTLPSDIVDSPIDPASINVLVANGSGIEGSAGALSDQLTSLGYEVFPPTDTTADATETPLDTVYFVEEPNTRPQARQVAHELGLSETAVVPYPGPDAAHADIALAQVLVVLGSASGQLAPSEGATATTTVSEDAGVEVAVVAFGTGDGLAIAEDLRALGYRVSEVRDGNGLVEGPTVFYVDPSFRAPAEQVATDLDISDSTVVELPDSYRHSLPPGTGVVVFIG